ncbi:MAG TPA: hypothetical protein EYP14_08380, partial [Planctomycetaceae bacterium]|nr:hypothetical protein [Planctomycetaceae bacterium]
MRFSWLANVRQRMRTRRQRRWTRRRRPIRPIRPQVEVCEDRTLLSVNVSFFAGTGELLIVATSGEDVAVGADASFNVQITINGAVYSDFPPIQTSLVNELRIEAGDGDNVLDVSGVTSAAGYPAGLAIEVNGGHGNDTLTGSADFAAVLNAGHGDDSILSTDASDTVYAGDGDDTVVGG